MEDKKNSMDEKVEDSVNQSMEPDNNEPEKSKTDKNKGNTHDSAEAKEEVKEEAKAENQNENPGDEADSTEAKSVDEGDKDKKDESESKEDTSEDINKKEKKDKKDQKIEELNDRLMRMMAEFDNYRKRTEKEKAQMFEIGAREIIERVLPVIDNFERGLGTLTEEEKEGAFAQGIEKIYKQLLTSLTEAGLKPIEAVGKPFDPNFHNAVMHAEDPEQGENLVVEEFQKGYMYKDTVVRHSMVKVVN